MPTYTAKCHSCGTGHTYIRKVEDRADTPVCCGVNAEKQLDTPQIGALAGSVQFVADAYGKQQWIETGTDLKRFMKENKLVTPGEGEERAVDARRNREIETDKKLDQAIDKAIEVTNFK